VTQGVRLQRLLNEGRPCNVCPLIEEACSGLQDSKDNLPIDLESGRVQVGSRFGELPSGWVQVLDRVKSD
jgi:hypothetical protein